MAVDWSGPRRRPTNLRFDHATHATSRASDCAACHTASGATTVRATMRALASARPEQCITCHAHRADSHLAEGAACGTCHLPLAQAKALDTARIAAFPRAPGHDVPGFVLNHKVDATVSRARCAICHARESCDRCHLNGDSVPAIAALETDSRIAMLAVGRRAEYPLPPSHKSGWDLRHAAAARAGSRSCGNCHAQAGCRNCHIGEGAREQIAALPVASPTGPQGVLAGAPGGPTVATKSAPGGKPALVRALAFAPPRLRAHPAAFAEAHGPAAASGSTNCQSCHAASFCSTCHQGSSKPVFHPANFMLRHGADAYGGANNCGSCHNTETFCRSCHQGAGIAGSGRADVAYHTGQPMWLLQHGEAARKGLEGCVSCHKQQDCTRCHSATGGWRVNPHGPGFDADRVSDRNQLVCGRCHVTIPGKTTP